MLHATTRRPTSPSRDAFSALSRFADVLGDPGDVSLTVAEIVRDRFSVALVPATLERTSLGSLEVGARVDLESDLLDKLARRHESRTADALRRIDSGASVA